MDGEERDVQSTPKNNVVVELSAMESEDSSHSVSDSGSYVCEDPLENIP